MTHIEQLIWSMLNEMGIDLMNDSDKMKLCNEYVEHIKDKIKKGCVNHLIIKK